jgi:hypothetical protein
MIGRNPLFVAQQHGHRILTMLTVYAAWTAGSPGTDILVIRRSMRAPAFASRTPPKDATRTRADWAKDWASTEAETQELRRLTKT